MRFHLPTSVTKIQKQVPVQYLEKEPNHQYKYNQNGIGFGKKSDFMEVRKEQVTPAPNRYDAFVKNSLSYRSKMSNPASNNGFYNKYDKYDNICYKGMEKHFYLRESAGPGAYLPIEYIYESKTQRAGQYSVPKDKRGLLSSKVK